MWCGRIFRIILLLLFMEDTCGRSDDRNVWRHRLKRAIIPAYHEDSIESFDSDNLDEYFPKNKFIRAEILQTDVSKRSRIPDVYHDFDEGNDGSLIVIDTDKTSEEQFHKKSDVDKIIKHANYKGFNIVLNSNGGNENEGRKDEILHEMETDSEDMEDRFGEFITNPVKHKKLRLILITPLKNQQGYERDNLPEPEDTSLDNLAEVHRGNIVLSENEGQDSTEQILSDSKRKSELEIDIDKLKHVKEKLKLLNEDDSHEQNKLALRNLTADEDTPSSHEVPHKVTEDNSDVKLLPAHKLTEDNGDVKRLPDKSINDKTAIEEATHEIKAKILGKNESTQTGARNHETNVTQGNYTVPGNHSLKDDPFKHEVKAIPLGNNSQAVQVDFNSSQTINQTTTIQKVADDTDDSNRKHEVSTSLPTEPSFTHNLLKPPGNPSPEDSPDLMNQQKPTVENPTKTSKIHSPDINVAKKEKTHESHSEPTSKVTSKDDTNVASKPISPTQPILLKTATTTTTKPLSSMKGNSSYNKSRETNQTETEKQAVEVSYSPKHHVSTEVHHDISLVEPKISDPVQNKHTVSSHEVNSVDSNQGITAPEPTPNVAMLPQAKIIDKRKAEAIIEFMNKDPLETWRYHFNTLKSLDLNSTILRSGLVNAGNIERLKGVMRRALEGKDVTLSVVGGSISAGGGLYKDRGNIEGLYYKGVVDWWNKMISPLTGSDMVVNNIAIGSIGTDYFSYCIKNHIANETDIVLWELSANDYNRYKTQATKGARPLERLTRQVLELPNKPAVLYVNFFKGIDYKNSKISCPDFEDQGEDIIAHYYKIPSLSWRAMVCNGLVRRDPGFSMETLFSNDQYHPSLRGHAQMSLLLLLHLRHVMRAVLQWAISHDGYIERFEEATMLPDPLFMGPKYPSPLCWTLITADLNDRISNSLNVKVVKDLGFKLEYATNFPIRFDKVICWKSEFPSAELVLQFEIPQYYGNTRNIKRTKSKIVITTHTRFGGRSSLWIDDRQDNAIMIKEGRVNDPGKRTQVDYIADDIEPGLHSLHIRAIEGGFCLASVMVDDS